MRSECAISPRSARSVPKRRGSLLRGPSKLGLTPAEKRYLRAMAELGPGPHRSGDIAEELGKAVTALGPTRNTLIAKGMIWSPNHGDTAFTVPMFDEFMRRIMPGDEGKSKARGKRS